MILPNRFSLIVFVQDLVKLCGCEREGEGEEGERVIKMCREVHYY